MVKADAVTLIETAYNGVDNIGIPIETEVRTEIPVEVRSISRSEWEAAGKQGLKPAIMLLTPECNYSGQELAELHGVKYGIYRTYVPAGSEMIELYLQKKVGVTDV